MTWFVIALAIVLPIVAMLAAAARRRQRRELTESRSPADLHDVFRSQYEPAMSREAFTRAWTDIAECLHIDPRFLRPSDRFGSDIGRSPITTEELDELADRAARHAREAGRDIDLQALRTVDDYIRVVGGMLNR